ncbi:MULTISPECIES: hypothetical protein [Pseudomonas]|nr:MULTISPECIES: hypothetical protein [Pseudomonas]
MNENTESKLEDMDLIEENASPLPAYNSVILTDYEAVAGKTAPEF